MWNPFKIRSNEARRLEVRMIEMEDDLQKVIRLVDKMDARWRKRDSVASGGPVAVSSSTPMATEIAPTMENDQRPERLGESPVYTKEQLRAFAKQRGMSA